MLLDVDKDIKLAIQKFDNYAPSTIFHHDNDCCTIAREWFRALDSSSLIKNVIFSGPTWIRLRWKWGPSKWPLFWCQIPHTNILDCGALASLACEAFRQRGLEVFPVQLIQKFSEQDTQHWRRRWKEKGLSLNWISGSLVYHEACAVLSDRRQVRVWDPTDNVWIRPFHRHGYATTVAIQFNTQKSIVGMLKWGDLSVTPDIWVVT